MSTAAIIAIAIGVVVVLGAISFFTLARRSDVRGAGALSGETVQKDKAARRSAEPVTTQITASDAEAAGVAARSTTTAVAVRPDADIVTWTPPDPEVMGVTRRQFFNRATVSLMSVSLAGFAAAAFVAFLWPSGTGGFGGSVTVGKIGAIKDGIKQGGGFFYAAEARSWITEYPADALPLAETVYSEAVLATMREGIVILSQKCPHLGCRVPDCKTSQWFECQCHGSQ
ncbi:MAG: Rieske 2Fe-2S domain-containing protein, partial [Mycobacteriales bacterium]